MRAFVWLFRPFLCICGDTHPPPRRVPAHASFLNKNRPYVCAVQSLAHPSHRVPLFLLMRERCSVLWVGCDLPNSSAC